MSSREHAAPGGGHSAGAPRQDEFWLTGVLRSDAVMMMIAREAAAIGGDGENGDLAVRRHLDAELRAAAGWPRGADYARIAADFETAGLTGEAVLLRRAAAADELLAEAAARWHHRYTGRPVSRAEQVTSALEHNGLVSFDPDGPYQGMDGALYRPGMLFRGVYGKPALGIASGGTVELITEWASYPAMTGWAASRGSTGSGPLSPPPVTSGEGSRAWREETVLARMLDSHAEIPVLAAALPPDTFTSHVRYDVYAAIITLAGRRQPFTSDDVAGELARRLCWVPAYAVAAYGGPGGTLAKTYLHRLADTWVSSQEAARAAAALRAEDMLERARGVKRPAEHTADPGRRPRQQPEYDAWRAVSGRPGHDDTVLPAPIVGPARPDIPDGPAPADSGLRRPGPPEPGTGPVMRA